MANIQIGHVFSEGVVAGKDAYGRWLVKAKVNDSKTKWVILQDKYISPTTTVKRSMSLYNLVVIGQGRKGRLRVALDGYMKDIVSYYYIIGPHNVYAEKSKWYVWYERWREECAEEITNNFTIEELEIEELEINTCYINSIFKLKGKNYVLPAIGYKDLDSLQGVLLFYPDTFFKNNLIARCIYKTDDADGFPKIYKAKLEGLSDKGISISMEVLIMLHGFTSPAKWHCGVWNHMLGLTPNSSGREHGLWEKVLGKGLPVSKNLFSNCKLNQKGTSCNEIYCVKESLFQKIHSQIKDYCKTYLEQMVTLFESNSTNIKVEVFERSDEESKELELGCIMDFKGTKGIQGGLLLRGKCHNWMDNRPVFHLTPITMFLDDKHSPNFKFKAKGKIFSGSLKEVKKC